jgi:VanZ family protein
MFSKRISRLAFACVYLILISILFFLPGSAFPQENWFSKIYLDKWIHAGIFLCLSLVWLWALDMNERRIYIQLLFLMGLYGLGVEIIQGLFIPNRSFDLFDLLSDMTGAVSGIFLRGRYIKK